MAKNQWGWVRKQSAFDAPQSHAPRRQLSPRVAAHNKWRRIETLQRNKTFLADYAAALQALRAGNNNITFPAGTYQLHADGHVRRHPA